jgi:hypothetical protein
MYKEQLPLNNNKVIEDPIKYLRLQGLTTTPSELWIDHHSNQSYQSQAETKKY